MKKLWSLYLRLLNLILRIDRLAINILEKISRKVQIWTGLNCILQARISMIMFLVLNITNGLMGYSYWPNVIYMTILNFWIYQKLEKIEERISRENMKGLRNSLKVSALGVLVRFSSVIILISYFLLLITTQGYLPDTPFITLAMYLLCCDTLPPAQGKLKEWLKSLFFTAKEAGVKA